MADVKITALPVLTAADPINDAVPIVDVSDNTITASGTTKRISINNILGASGTATLASATITGALTVDTTTLVVDPTNNRVGIGTASPAAGYSLDILGAAVGGIRVSSNNYPNLVIDSANSNGAVIYIQEGGITQARIGHLTSITGLEFSGNNGTIATNVHYGIDATGISTWKNVGGVAGTAMTLNASGLGIGISPAAQVHVYGAGSGSGTVRFQAASGRSFDVGSTGSGYGSTNNFIIYDVTSAAERLRIDSSGNVGIGVTPSGWNATYNALDIGQNGSISGRTSTNNTVDIVSNGFRNSGGTWVYKLAASSAASRYQIDGGSGSHLWYNGVAGTAGNTIAGFSTPIMTLDANGNLILLPSNTPATLTANGQLTVNATSNTNLRFSYRGSDGTTRVANITLA